MSNKFDNGYGNAVPAHQYGYGNAVPAHQYGNAVPAHQYGNAVPAHQYGYGNAVPAHQYGNNNYSSDLTHRGYMQQPPMQGFYQMQPQYHMRGNQNNSSDLTHRGHMPQVPMQGYQHNMQQPATQGFHQMQQPTQGFQYQQRVQPQYHVHNNNAQQQNTIALFKVHTTLLQVSQKLSDISKKYDDHSNDKSKEINDETKIKDVQSLTGINNALVKINEDIMRHTGQNVEQISKLQSRMQLIVNNIYKAWELASKDTTAKPAPTQEELPPSTQPTSFVTTPPATQPTSFVTTPPATQPTSFVTTPPATQPTSFVTTPPATQPTSFVTTPPATQPTSFVTTPPATQPTSFVTTPPATQPTSFVTTPPPATQPTSPAATVPPPPPPPPPPLPLPLPLLPLSLSKPASKDLQRSTVAAAAEIQSVPKESWLEQIAQKQEALTHNEDGEIDRQLQKNKESRKNELSTEHILQEHSPGNPQDVNKRMSLDLEKALLTRVNATHGVDESNDLAFLEDIKKISREADNMPILKSIVKSLIPLGDAMKALYTRANDSTTIKTDSKQTNALITDLKDALKKLTENPSGANNWKDKMNSSDLSTYNELTRNLSKDLHELAEKCQSIVDEWGEEDIDTKDLNEIKALTTALEKKIVDAEKDIIQAVALPAQVITATRHAGQLMENMGARISNGDCRTVKPDPYTKDESENSLNSRQDGDDHLSR